MPTPPTTYPTPPSPSSAGTLPFPLTSLLRASAASYPAAVKHLNAAPFGEVVALPSCPQLANGTARFLSSRPAFLIFLVAAPGIAERAYSSSDLRARILASGQGSQRR